MDPYENQSEKELEAASAGEEEQAALLTPIEARVLGCLIEKEATTPDAYPLTLNSTTTACNQKSSREPVMKLELGQVGHALRELERKGLVRHEFSPRAERYRHTAEKGLELTRAQLALVTLLILRGPQTVSELVTRSTRIHRFEDADDAQFNLERLTQKEPALVTLLPRQPGQRGQRWAHLLSGPVAVEAGAVAASPAPASGTEELYEELLERMEALEERVAELEQALADRHSAGEA